MPREEASLTWFGITQQFDPEFWNWTDAEQSALGNIKAMAEIVKRRIETMYPETKIAALYAVKHDRCKVKVWNAELSRNEMRDKVEHVHMLAKFADDGERLKIADIAKAVGVDPQYIEKPKTGRYAADNMLAYLIHAKDASKAQYEPDEVVTIVGEDYADIYAERKDAWERGRAKKSKAKAKEDIEWLVQNILAGNVTKSQVMLTDELFVTYSQYQTRCEQAFEANGQRKAYKTIAAMESGEYRLCVFYITGKSGSGKSWFTDGLARQFVHYASKCLDERWSVCSVASNNPLDDWCGEEILVMDDLRGMSMTASDWLKLLDPDRVNRAGTRYKNKLIAPRIILINAEKDVYEFFYYMKGSGGGDRSEAMDQFIRRIMSRIHVIHAPSEQDVERRLASIRPMQKLAAPEHIEIGDDAVDLNYGFTGEEEYQAVELITDTLLCQAFGESYMTIGDDNERADEAEENSDD